jgi:hypothetical protein
MSTHILIDAIEPRTLTIKVRDTKTGEEHPFVLKGNGPWDIDLSRPGHGTSEEPEVAPPPDDEITLRLNCTSEDRFVRVHAIGSGAVAWSQKQAALLGVPWTRDQQGAPHVNLAKKRTLLDDIRKALPGVKVDTSGCHDVDVNPAAVGWHRAAGETKRGERMVVHATGPTDQVGVSEVNAAKQGGKPEYGTDAMHVLGREAKRGQRIPEADLKLAELDDLSGSPDGVTPPNSVEAPTDLEPGPGVLQWESITDNGVPGFAARWKKGTFKLLHVAGEQYALFYEHDDGKGYEMIVCDTLARAKRTAGERMKAIPGAQLIHVVCRHAVRYEEAAAFVLDAFSLPGFVPETRKRALDFELAILHADTEEVVATVNMNEKPVVITWNDDEMDEETAEAIVREVNRVLELAEPPDAESPDTAPQAPATSPAEAPAVEAGPRVAGPRVAPRVRKEASTDERGGRTRTPRAPKPPTTTPPPASPAPNTDDTPEAMDKELMTSFTTELDNVLAEDD